MECIYVDRRLRALTTGLLCFCLFYTAPPAWSAQESDELARNELDLLTHYYLHPVPRSVPVILGRLAGSNNLASRVEAGNDLSGTAYLFARLARSEPDLLPEYEELFQKTGHPGRVLLIRIFEIMGGEEATAYLQKKLEDQSCAQEKGDIMRALASLPAGVNVYLMPIEKASDLDMLWSEFMVTGQRKAVERIMEVLDRPDITRQKLEEYLKTHMADEDDGVVAAFKYNLWVFCDGQAGRIVSRKDLDISLVVFSLRPEHPREAVKFMRDSLGIDDEAFSRAALKASAAWSLMNNAHEHPRILDICREDAQGKKTPVKLALLCVPACFHEDHLQFKEAVAAFMEMADEDPSNLDVHLHLMRLAIEKRDLVMARRELALFREKGLEPGRAVEREFSFLEKLLLGNDGMREDPESVDIESVVSSTVERTGTLQSYSSEVFIIPIPLPSGARCPFPMKFTMDYENPDRFSVSERTVSDPEAMPVYEKWVALGSDNYSLSRKWYKVPPIAGNHDKTNAMLRMDKWARMLEANPLGAAKAYDAGDKRYYCLSFPVDHADEMLPDFVSADRKGSAEVWVDAGTYDIVACEIRSLTHDAGGNTLGIMLQQVFGDFDNAGPVSAPDNFIDLSQGVSKSVM